MEQYHLRFLFWVKSLKMFLLLALRLGLPYLNLSNQIAVFHVRNEFEPVLLEFGTVLLIHEWHSLFHFYQKERVQSKQMTYAWSINACLVRHSAIHDHKRVERL